MFSGKDAVNPAYPTQWALNPTAYQNIDSSQVDWAALAQQWIAMKEATAVVTAPQPPPKPEVEGGEAPMEVENPEANCEHVGPPGSEWNSTTNSWGNSWNQWGWGWGGPDSKIPGDPSMPVPPMMDGYPVPPENPPAMPGYSTGPVPAPTFQHGYWTAPQGDQNNSRSNSRPRDNRSKSKPRETKLMRPRTNRDKIPMIPQLMEPMTMPPMGAVTTIDAAKRRQLPAWIREGLEKMEREKQRAIEREQEQKAREEAEKEKKRLEEEELERLKAEAGGQPMLPAKSKFDSDSESEETSKELQEAVEPEAKVEEKSSEEKPVVIEEPEEKSTLIKKSKEEIMQEVMFAVRRSLTEILLEVTDQEIHTVSQEELARYNAAQASRLNAMKASKSKALAAIASGLGLGAYESSSDESGDEEQKDLTDQQLQEIIKRKRLDFERTARDIEAEVKKAELRENAEEPTTPVVTPERRRRSRSSITPSPIDTEAPEKGPERRPSRDKRATNHKSNDKADGAKRLSAIPEERGKKTSRYGSTPSPKKASDKDTTTSSSTGSDSSTSSESSSDSDSDVKVSKSSRRKRHSSSESSRRSKTAKRKRSQRSNDRSTNKQEAKSRSKRRDDRHKSSKYRRESEDERPRRRRQSRDSEERRRKRSRDRRPHDAERSRDKRSHDMEPSRDRRSRDRRSHETERSRDKRSRDKRSHDKYDRYERGRSRSRSRHRR